MTPDIALAVSVGVGITTGSLVSVYKPRMSMSIGILASMATMTTLFFLYS